MEKIEDRYEYFYKPKTKQEIIGKRELINATRYDLAEKVRKLSEDQAIIMDYAEGKSDQVLVPEKYSSSENFLKHGKKIVIDSSRPMWESREEKFRSLYEKRKNEKDHFAEYSGITWKPHKGTLDERSRIVHLVDCMEAVRIFNYTINAPGCDVNFVHEAKPSKKGPYEGANYGIDIPSRSEEKRQDVRITLKHVPYTRKGTPIKIAASLEGMCDCEYNRFHNLIYQDEPSGRKSPVFMDMHHIAGYLFVIEKEQKDLDSFLRKKGKERKICMAMVNNPFPLPKQKVLDDYIKLENQVMIRDIVKDKKNAMQLRKDGKPRIHHRKLNRAEKEVFLFNYIARYGPKTFFATKKLRDYNIPVRSYKIDN